VDELDNTAAGGARPRRRDLLLKGGALAAAATAATAAGVVGAGSASAVTGPFAPLYLPFGPQRVYDSRNGDGPLPSNFERTLTQDSAPPATDLAYLFNLTVTGTTGTGFLGMFSADIGWPGNSSINWFGPNQLLSNNVYTAFRPSDAGVTVICGGGGSTDFVMDLCAILTNTDLSTITSIQAELASHSRRYSKAS
jgi:hypothetical protein